MEGGEKEGDAVDFLMGLDPSLRNVWRDYTDRNLMSFSKNNNSNNNGTSLLRRGTKEKQTCSWFRTIKGTPFNVQVCKVARDK